MLEVRREDMMSTDRDIADILAKAGSGNNISMADTTALIERLAATQDLMAQLLMNQKNPVVEAVPEVNLCLATKADGTACKGKQMENGYCVFHQEKDGNKEV